MSGYAFHPDAFADLDEIWEYIAQDNIDSADRLLADIHTVLRTLAVSPLIGHRRPDLTARPLRFHVVRDEYLIAYAPDEKPLWVLAVFHVWPPMHPGWLRCSSLTYVEYARSSRLASRAPRRPEWHLDSLTRPYLRVTSIE